MQRKARYLTPLRVLNREQRDLISGVPNHVVISAHWCGPCFLKERFLNESKTN